MQLIEQPEFPAASVSAALVKGTQTAFIACYREPQPYLQIFSAENSIISHRVKLLGHRNSFILCRPAAFQLSAERSIAIMGDENRGFCLWLAETNAQTCETPAWETSDKNGAIVHCDMERVDEKTLLFACVTLNSLSVYKLSLEYLIIF